MTFFEVLLNILAIVGIIVLGALIVYFLAVLVLSITGKNEKTKSESSNSQFGRPKVLDSNELDENYGLGGKVEEKVEEVQQQPSLTYEDKFKFDEELEKERKAKIEEKRNLEDDFDDFDDIFNTEENEILSTNNQESDEDELNELIEKINKESIEQYKQNLQKNETKAEAVSDPEINLFEDLGIEETPAEEITEEEVVVKTDEELEKEKEEIERQKAELEEQRKALEEERRKMEEYKQEIANLEQQVQDKDSNSMYTTWGIDQLYERLEVLRARLKANEKDLKANRKEYNPLARVKRVLEKDKEKLRRREAIVARKKVILYGVNNYVDIDEEKAKKLSEDLDLLDGLRLSVQHCEEVMNANKDRFPILEKTNRILVETNQNIKDDIAEVEAAITARNTNNDEI